MMGQSDKYHKTNDLQNDINASIVRRYFNLLTWKGNETVLDIGTGDGEYTVEGLLPVLPKDIKLLIGTDASLERINFAKKNYSTSGVEFDVMDIQSKALPEKFRERMDHIFSFFCLNWIRDYRTTFENIYNMLKPDGQFLITFPEHGVESALNELSKNPRWASYDHKQFITKFVDLHDTLPYWKKEIESVGFVDLNCFRENIAYVHKSQEICEDMYKSIDPIWENIPEEDQADYYRDFMNALRKYKLMSIEKVHDSDKTKCISYLTQITIYGKKPKCDEK